jgi:hypothetical protein
LESTSIINFRGVKRVLYKKHYTVHPEQKATAFYEAGSYFLHEMGAFLVNSAVSVEQKDKRQSICSAFLLAFLEQYAIIKENGFGGVL